VDCSRHFNALFRIAGKYQGQWQEGKRHGYGIRTSAPFGLASHHRRKNLHASLSSLRSGENGNAAKLAEKAEEIRGGFVLTAKSDKLPVRRNSLTDKTGKKGFLMVSLKGDYFLISFTYFPQSKPTYLKFRQIFFEFALLPKNFIHFLFVSIFFSYNFQKNYHLL